MKSNHQDNIKQAFTERFLKALKMLGHTYNEQKKMHQLFGVSGQAVRKWAEGQSMPTSSRMPNVAKVLGVRRAWLQDGEEPIHPLVAYVSKEKHHESNTELKFSITPEEADFLNIYRTLTSKQRALIRQTLSVLIEKK